jgi:hypothetical protein
MQGGKYWQSFHIRRMIRIDAKIKVVEESAGK